MGRSTRGRGLVLGVSLLALAGFGCTPEPVTPTPPPTSAASATPTETAQEREERLAYEAAEKSYREFSAEYRHVTGAGGAAEPTERMKDTAAGPYLADAAKVIEAFKETGGYTKGSARFGYIRPAGYSTKSLLLDVCEDETGVQTYNAKRKQIATNGILLLQLEVRSIKGQWKVWDYTGKEAKTCA